MTEVSVFLVFKMFTYFIWIKNFYDRMRSNELIYLYDKLILSATTLRHIVRSKNKNTETFSLDLMS